MAARLLSIAHFKIPCDLCSCLSHFRGPSKIDHAVIHRVSHEMRMGKGSNFLSLSENCEPNEFLWLILPPLQIQSFHLRHTWLFEFKLTVLHLYPWWDNRGKKHSLFPTIKWFFFNRLTRQQGLLEIVFVVFIHHLPSLRFKTNSLNFFPQFWRGAIDMKH